MRVFKLLPHDCADGKWQIASRWPRAIQPSSAKFARQRVSKAASATRGESTFAYHRIFNIEDTVPPPTRYKNDLSGVADAFKWFSTAALCACQGAKEHTHTIDTHYTHYN